MSSSTFLLGTSGSLGHTGAYISGSGGNLEISSSNFFLKENGSLNIGAGNFTVATNGDVAMAGNISATTGDIGGFVIGTNDLWGGNAAIGNAATTIVMGNLDGVSKIALGASADSIRTDAGTGFYADGTGSFKVGAANSYGIVWEGSSLQISSSEFYFGDATNFISGSGGAISIGADTFDLSTTYLRMSSSYGSSIAMGSTIPTNLSSNGIFLSGSGEFNFQQDDSNYIRYTKALGTNIKSAKFALETTNLIMTTGSAAAASGKIVLSGADQHIKVGTAVSIDGDGDGNYGSITIGSKVILRGNSDSTISGWTIGSSTIQSVNDKVILDSTGDGEIRLGDVPPASATSGTGIFLGGDGDFLAGASAGNHFQFLSGGALDIQSGVFSLNATTIIIDSSANDGKIALGDTPPTSVDYTANAGIYMDGTGDFLAYGDGDNFIKKDGTALTLKAETFTLDATTLYLDNTTPSLRFANDASAFSYQDNSGIFIGKNGSYYVMSLKGSSGGSLDWNGNGTLSITGDITVTNTSDFADSGGALSGSQLYENFRADVDTDKWITANISQSVHAQTVDDRDYNHMRLWRDAAGGNAWDAGMISKAVFLRSESPVMEFDIMANHNAPRIHIGFFSGSLDELNTTTNKDHMVESIYFHYNDLEPWADHDNNNVATQQGEFVPTLQTAWAAGDDTHFRCRITLKPSGGAHYEVFKDGDYSSPVAEKDTTGSTHAKLRAGITVNKNETSSPGYTLYLGQLGVNSPPSTTVISGDGITTGKLTSTNYGTSTGTQIDLDAGTAVFGGSDGDGITFAANGDITSNNFLIERSRLFGAGTDGDITLTTGTDQSSLAGDLFDSHNSTANLWTLTGDVYCGDLQINSSVTLKTNGYRLFVRNTLTNNGTIANRGLIGTDGTANEGSINGNGQTGGAGGIGAPGGTLHSGSAGGTGGTGGNAAGDAYGGAGGGGAGGSGGIMYIACRTLVNSSGTITVKGGDGGNGGNAAV